MKLRKLSSSGRCGFKPAMNTPIGRRSPGCGMGSRGAAGRTLPSSHRPSACWIELDDDLRRLLEQLLKWPKFGAIEQKCRRGFRLAASKAGERHALHGAIVGERIAERKWQIARSEE